MLRLKIAGQYVDLPNDFSFTMNMKSPVFNDIGNFSYPFRIPATARNAIILAFPHRLPNTGNPYRDIDSRFEWNGITLFAGIARLKTVSDKSYEGAVFDGNGDFYYQLKNRQLQQIDMGEMVFSDEATALAYLNSTIPLCYPDVPLACPQVYNENYFDPPTSNSQLKYFNYNYPGMLLQTSNTSERTILVPMLYLRYVLAKLFAGLSYELDDQMFTSHADFNKLVLFNSTCCNNAGVNFPERFPSNYSLSHLTFNQHVPRLPVVEFMKGLENMFGLGMFVDNTSRKVRLIKLESIINNSSYDDFSKNVISKSFESEEAKTGYKFQMTLDGDDTAAQVMTDFEDKIAALYSGSVKDLSYLPSFPIGEIGSIYYVEDLMEFYQMNTAKNWVVNSLLSLLRTRFFFRTGEQSLETKFSVPWNDGNKMIVTNAMEKYKEITPRLFFTEYVNPSLPLLGLHGTDHTANFSLYYPWENGLFNKFWLDFMQFRANAKLVKIQRQMDFSELRDFDFSRKIMVDGVKMLVRSLQVTIKKDRIMPATLECYTVDNDV
jgi:hypothetical protein